MHCCSKIKDIESTIYCLGFLKGMGSNIKLFKVENGKYEGADEPQKPQNFVRPSK